jgi:hypothetical protein
MVLGVSAVVALKMVIDHSTETFYRETTSIVFNVLHRQGEIEIQALVCIVHCEFESNDDPVVSWAPINALDRMGMEGLIAQKRIGECTLIELTERGRTAAHERLTVH